MAQNFLFPNMDLNIPGLSVTMPTFDINQNFNNYTKERDSELLEDNANPYVPIDDLGNGWYAGDERGIGILNSMRSNIGDLLEAFNQLLKKAEKIHWWTSRKKQRERLGALSAEKDRLVLSLDAYNKERTRLGLEGVVPPLEDYSEETLNLTIEESTQQSASNRAASLEALKTKGPEYIGAAADIANIFTNDPKAYNGAKGSLTQGLDSAGDAMANAAMASGNPYAMAAAAAYKVMGFANRAIGGGTDGMTGIDAALDSNLGFLATGGLSKLNGALGGTTDKFEVDNDLKAQMSSSYMDTYGELGDAASVAGKRYGFLSRGKMKKALDDIAMAKARQDTISGINETAQDRIAAGNYEGIGFRNLMSLNGGFNSMRAARKGIKMTLDFAHKVVRALKGIRFNRFDMVTGNGVKINTTEDTPLNSGIQTEEPEDLLSNLSEADLNALGIRYLGNTEGVITYSVGTRELAEQLNKNNAFKNRLKRKYKGNDVIFLYLGADLSSLNPLLPASLLATQAANLQPVQTQEGLQENESVSIDEESAQEVGESTETAEDEALSEESSGEDGTEPEARISANPIENLPTSFTNFSNYTPDNPRPSYGIIDYNTLSQLLPIVLNGLIEEFRKACLQYNPDMSQQGIAELYTDLRNGKLNLGLITPRDTSILNLGVPQLKNGGVFTFMPYTDEQVTKFKEGGSFNVIPDGALHKNRHNMEDAEGLTKKGIPVITEEDGKKVQQAEIEVNEIIFRLEVTEKLEKLAKEGTDEAALEAGKLLTEEILHNTHDNTGLIKETV